MLFVWSVCPARNVQLITYKLSNKAIPPSFKETALSSRTKLRGQGKESMDNVTRSHRNTRVIIAITTVLTSYITINHGGEL